MTVAAVTVTERRLNKVFLNKLFQVIFTDALITCSECSLIYYTRSFEALYGAGHLSFFQLCQLSGAKKRGFKKLLHSVPVLDQKLLNSIGKILNFLTNFAVHGTTSQFLNQRAKMSSLRCDRTPVELQQKS